VIVSLIFQFSEEFLILIKFLDLYSHFSFELPEERLKVTWGVSGLVLGVE
jgi:hypothetical protein